MAEDEEYGVLLEEREGLMRPPEVVVLYVEVLLAFPLPFVVAYDFLLRGLPVVCDDASVCVELVGEGDVHVPCRPPPSAGPRGGNAHPP